MRRYILLFIALCLHFSARGQTPYEYRYWFDGDISTAETGSTTSDAWSMEVDLSRLKESFHTIHLQVTDEKGVSSAPMTRCFFISREGGALTNGYYWFDDEVQARTVKGDVQGALTIDVSELQEGFHTLHYQVKRADGMYSQIETRNFYKMQSDQIVGELTFMCYIDGMTFKQERVSVENGTAVWFLDVSELPIGFHKLQVRAIMQNGSSTTNREAFFLREAMPSELNAMKCICSIDGKVFKQETMQTTNGAALWQIDVSELPIGFHKLQFRAVMENGASTSIREAFFLRNAMDAELEALSCVFSVDGKPYKTIESGVQEGLFHCDLDVAELPDGLHKISYMLTNGKGAQTTVKSQYFIKQPVGGNSIKMYQYWLNDNDDMAHTVVQQEVTDPLKLIALLPVETQPLRSKLFHFEVKGDQLMMYAKNNFHVRFYDAAGRFTDATEQYVDYNVSRKVEDVEWLEPGARATTVKPGENEVKWYCLEAEPGDSLQFKLDRAATIQLFAPSGEETHNVSGSESVKWNGLHVRESGTYYLALHDVTATQGTTVSLDYNHIDKYAVLRQDVSVVGNGGCSTITFEGNGFRDLYAVDLYDVKGDTIKHAAICHTSDAEVSVTFDFTDADLGAYDALFHFATEDRCFTNMITVEEAKSIELALNVQYPSTFLRGTTTTYTISVTNKGNATAYHVPMEICIVGSSINNIQSLTFKDNDTPNNKYSLEIEKDSIDAETLYYIDNLFNSVGGLHSFIVVKDSLGNSEYAFTDQLITIPSYGTVSFSIEIVCSSEISLYAKIPSDWITINTHEVSPESRRRAFSDSKWCCEKEKWECTVNIIANLVGLFPVAGCFSALADAAFFTTFEIACTEGHSLGDKELKFYNSIMTNSEKRESVIDRSISGVAGCIAGAAGKAIAKLRKELKVVQEARAIAVKNSEHYYQQYLKSKELYDYYVRVGDNVSAEAASATCKSYFNDYLRYDDEAKTLFSRIKNLENQINVEELRLKDLKEKVVDGITTVVTNSECVKEWKDSSKKCPKDQNKGGGTSTLVNSCEPNDILGYVAESGSHAIRDGVTDVFYTIQFENDTVFATAPANDIYLTDTLDVNLFDLSTYRPTKITIGEKSMELSGERNFISTLDMRPEINAIAQIEGTIDDKTGVVRWHISSLDPMTMEPLDDPMEGVLPVNFDGSGLGEASFTVSLKNDLPHGTEIPNRSGNVFDNNETVLTPTWTNVIDKIAPVSHVSDVQQMNDSVAVVSIDATDELSGVWRYDVFVQYGSGAWFKAAENVPADTVAYVKIYDGIEHNFYVLATDSAGNVEVKVPEREFTLAVGDAKPTGDVNGDGKVGIGDIIAVTSYMAGLGGGITLEMADVNGDGKVGIGDIVAVTDIMAGTAKARAKNKNLYKTYFVRRKEKMINEP